MPQFEPGVYIITPKGSNVLPAFGIGPVPPIFPPRDVPVRVLDKLIDRWIIDFSPEGKNTFTVFSGRGLPNDYKWIVNDEALYVSSVSSPDSFRFESAGDRLWKIGLFGKDAVLTYDAESEVPQLTFKPADGSDAQLFQAVPIFRD